MAENKNKVDLTLPKGKMVKVFNFNEAYVAPTYKYDKANGFIKWGDKNDYPSYILDMYNNYGSTTHKSIINRKVKMIAGYGFKTISDVRLDSLISSISLEAEMKKAALDYELFNGFAFEVIWDKAGENITSIEQIPMHKLRLGIKNTEIDFDHVWFSNDWSQYKKVDYEPEMIRVFDPELKSGKQIYIHIEYNPQTDGLYPIPSYSTSINWIEMDYEISKFHLNQVKQGYTPSFILNFATGIPSEEEQDEFFKDFKRNYSGTDNSGKIIITYSEGSEQKPELTKVDLNDSDERFSMLMEQIDQKIVTGAEIPPQLLLSVAGKLGGTEQREELKAEFQDSYISPRQNSMESVLNEILSSAGFDEEVELLTYEGEQTDVVVVDDAQAAGQAALKSSVGGVQALIAIQQSVAAGTTSRDAAKASIELLYGFSPEDADRLLGTVQEGELLDEGDTIASDA